MKKLLLILFIFLSFNSNAFVINDDKNTILSLIKTFELLNIPLDIPHNIDSKLGFNNGNKRVSPGELILVNRENIDRDNFTCLLKIFREEGWQSQNAARRTLGMNSKLCVNGAKECFISMVNLNMERETGRILMAVSTWTPPGTEYRCSSYSDTFEGIIID